MSKNTTLADFIEEEELEYAMIVGMSKEGKRVAALMGEPDDFQVAGMARYIYDITRFSLETKLEDEVIEDEDEDEEEDW